MLVLVGKACTIPDLSPRLTEKRQREPSRNTYIFLLSWCPAVMRATVPAYLIHGRSTLPGGGAVRTPHRGHPLYSVDRCEQPTHCGTANSGGSGGHVGWRDLDSTAIRSTSWCLSEGVAGFALHCSGTREPADGLSNCPFLRPVHGATSGGQYAKEAEPRHTLPSSHSHAAGLT